MMVRDKDIELVIDALVFRIRHLETELAWQEICAQSPNGVCELKILNVLVAQ